MKEDEGIPKEFRDSVPEKGELARDRILDSCVSLHSRNCALLGQFTDWQIRRAAKLTQRLIDFKIRLDRYISFSSGNAKRFLTLDSLHSQEILPDSSRAGPFEMFQYSR